jgi:hypothetical protein
VLSQDDRNAIAGHEHAAQVVPCLRRGLPSRVDPLHPSSYGSFAMGAMDKTDPNYKGYRGYNRFMLTIYDPWVLGFTARAIWKVPIPPGIERYRRNLGQRHLDVGPGTGYSSRRPRRRRGRRSPCSIPTRTCSRGAPVG